jgi:DNA-binding XRE family transcriptional regulator
MDLARLVACYSVFDSLPIAPQFQNPRVVLADVEIENFRKRYPLALSGVKQREDAVALSPGNHVYIRNSVHKEIDTSKQIVYSWCSIHVGGATMPSFQDRDRLKRVRIEQGLTQDALGELAGVSRDVIANLESGRGGIELTTARKVWEALGEFEIAIQPLEINISGHRERIRRLESHIGAMKREIAAVRRWVKQDLEEKKRLTVLMKRGASK